MIDLLFHKARLPKHWNCFLVINELLHDCITIRLIVVFVHFRSRFAFLYYFLFVIWSLVVLAVCCMLKVHMALRPNTRWHLFSFVWFFFFYFLNWNFVLVL